MLNDGYDLNFTKRLQEMKSFAVNVHDIHEYHP